MRWTKTREKAAFFFAIVLLVVAGGAVATYLGYNIPVLSDILKSLL